MATSAHEQAANKFRLFDLPQELQDGIFEFAYLHQDNWRLVFKDEWRHHREEARKYSRRLVNHPTFHHKVDEWLASKRYLLAASKAWISAQEFEPRGHTLGLYFLRHLRENKTSLLHCFVKQVSLEVDSSLSLNRIYRFQSLSHLDITLEWEFVTIKDTNFYPWLKELDTNAAQCAVQRLGLDKIRGLRKLRISTGTCEYADTPEKLELLKRNTRKMTEIARRSAYLPKDPLPSSPSDQNIPLHPGSGVNLSMDWPVSSKPSKAAISNTGLLGRVLRHQPKPVIKQGTGSKPHPEGRSSEKVQRDHHNGPTTRGTPLQTRIDTTSASLAYVPNHSRGVRIMRGPSSSAVCPTLDELIEKYHKPRGFSTFKADNWLNTAWSGFLSTPIVARKHPTALTHLATTANLHVDTKGQLADEQDCADIETGPDTKHRTDCKAADQRVLLTRSIIHTISLSPIEAQQARSSHGRGNGAVEETDGIFGKDRETLEAELEAVEKELADVDSQLAKHTIGGNDNVAD